MPTPNYYNKFYDGSFDDRFAYYRYKPEEYNDILLMCGIISHDIDKEQYYCLYKPKEIIEDWMMVLGFDTKGIDYHALNGKLMLYVQEEYVSEEIDRFPQDENKRKKAIFDKLGFHFGKLRFPFRREVAYDVMPHIACSQIVTNFDISDIKDIFNKMGIEPNVFNWDLANRKYLVTCYNTFVYCGHNPAKSSEICNAFGSLDKAEKIRNDFWHKRYPEDVKIMEEFKYYKKIKNEIKEVLEDNKGICAADNYNIETCFLTLMIYKNRYDYLTEADPEQKQLSDSSKIDFLAELISILVPNKLKISFCKEDYPLKRNQCEYLKGIVSKEIEKLTHLYYNNPKDLIATYCIYNIYFRVRIYLQQVGVFVPDKDKDMKGFVYYRLINSIKWRRKVGVQDKSLLIYKLLNIVELEQCSETYIDNEINNNLRTKCDNYKKYMEQEKEAMREYFKFGFNHPSFALKILGIEL